MFVLPRRSGEFLVQAALAGGLTAALCSTASAGQPHACKLIDPAAAGRILGARITAQPVDTSLAGKDAASMCNYTSQSVHGGFMLLAARLHYADLSKEVAREKESVIEDSAPPGTKWPKPKLNDYRLAPVGFSACCSIY